MPTPDMKHNPVGWFEIPVKDMDRAQKFYEEVFSVKLQRQKMKELEMAWFPMIDKAIGATGSLVKNEWYKPSEGGVLIYFTAESGDVANELKKAVSAGGKEIVPKTKISDDIGYMAVFLDTEGNRIALHSRIV